MLGDMMVLACFSVFCVFFKVAVLQSGKTTNAYMKLISFIEVLGLFECVFDAKVVLFSQSCFFSWSITVGSS